MFRTPLMLIMKIGNAYICKVFFDQLIEQFRLNLHIKMFNSNEVINCCSHMKLSAKEPIISQICCKEATCDKCCTNDKWYLPKYTENAKNKYFKEIQRDKCIEKTSHIAADLTCSVENAKNNYFRSIQNNECFTRHEQTYSNLACAVEQAKCHYFTSIEKDKCIANSNVLCEDFCCSIENSKTKYFDSVDKTHCVPHSTKPWDELLVCECPTDKCPCKCRA